MKKFRKLSIIITVILSVLTCFSLAACSEKPQQTAEKDNDVLRINKVLLEMNIYDAYEFTVQYNGDKTLEWTSSDNKIAKITNNVVEAIGVGSAIITVKAGELNKQCQINVKDNGLVPLIFVDLHTDNCSLNINDTYDLKTSLSFNEKAYTDAEFVYTVIGESIEVSKNGVIKAKTAGEAEIVIEAIWRDFVKTTTKTIKVKVL